PREPLGRLVPPVSTPSPLPPGPTRRALVLPGTAAGAGSAVGRVDHRAVAMAAVLGAVLWDDVLPERLVARPMDRAGAFQLSNRADPGRDRRVRPGRRGFPLRQPAVLAGRRPTGRAARAERPRAALPGRALHLPPLPTGGPAPAVALERGAATHDLRRF